MKSCLNCKIGNLHKVPPDEPWHTDYYICNNCDSTYNAFEIEEEDINDEDKEEMKCLLI